MTDSAEISKVRELAHSVATWKSDAAVKPELGVFDFSRLRDLLSDIGGIAEQIEHLRLEELPQRIVALFHGYLDNVIAKYQSLDQFDPTQVSEPKRHRDALSNEFEIAGYQFIDRVIPVIAYGQAGRMANATRTDRLRAQLAADELTQAADAASKRLQELEEALRVAREDIGKVGVSAHAKHFREAAEASDKASKRWLIATGCAAAIVIAGAWYNYAIALHSDPTLSGPAVVHLVTAKILFFSVAISVVVWCGRIYRANRHNYLVNKHRQNALSSLETFAQATDDPQTKNAVLLQSTKSVFEPQSTGFVDQAGEPQPSTQLIELWKSVAGGHP